MRTKSIIFLGIIAIGIAYLSAFKNPLHQEILQNILSDDIYDKLTNEQKRMPENALAGININDSLSATLFASEPTISNPTDIDIDARGRVWLCEGHNYRMQHNEGAKINYEGDRIVILEDTDGNGIADKTKIFYQGIDINAALGILVLGNKVIVSCSPKVYVFTDDNGDDIADRKEILFKGIGGEQHDHSIHAFVFGPDGKLYFNYGNEGGKLLDKNDEPVKDKYGNIVTAKGQPYRQGMVFRCNIDGSDLEVLGHNFRNNYEVAVDAFGTMWQSDNDDDGSKSVRINYVMEYGSYGYTDELTGAGWQADRTNIEKEIPRRHWHQNDPGTIPNLLITGAGSPTGIMVYEGDMLPKRFQNQMIHCDAGPKVVRAYPVSKSGAGYTATMADMMKGKDDWFRPSDVCAAPDGSLMVADWYDPGVGGHQRGDIAKGRVYRLSSNTSKIYKNPSLDLSNSETAAKALTNPNMATRYLAWEKLKSQGATGELAVSKLLVSQNPRVRARGYWFLSKLADKTKATAFIQKALLDKDEDVRVAAIRMARQTIDNPLSILKLAAKDNSIFVKREIAIALRNMAANEESAQLWAELAMAYDGKDRWYLEALGIGADLHWNPFFTAWKTKVGEKWNTMAGRDIVWRARGSEALPYLEKLLLDPNTEKAEISKYFRALDFHPESAARTEISNNLINATGPNKSEIVDICLSKLFASDVQNSPKIKQMVYQRLLEIKGTSEYIEMVNRFKLKDQSQEIYKIIVKSSDKSAREEAAKALVNLDGLTTIKEVVKSKPIPERELILESMVYSEQKEVLEFKKSIILDETQPLGVRKAVINSFRWGWDGQDYLMVLVKNGQISKALEPTIGNLFFNADRQEVRAVAANYIKLPSAGDVTLPSISELSKKKGVIQNGLLMYNKHCSSCHVVNNKGIDFGPGLSEIGDKFGKEGLYMAILMPDAGVSFGYEGFTIKLKSGGGASGIIRSQTETDLELKMIGGKINYMKQSDVLEKKKMERSMMPSLFTAMSEQELVDLTEYLTTLKKDN